MGHIHLGRLPGSKRWSAVVDLLETGAPDIDVIAGSAIAAEKDLAGAVNNAVFVEAVRVLANLPQIARREPFGGGLRRLGLDVPDDPSLLDLASAIGGHLDAVAMSAGRNDFGEISRRALLDTVMDKSVPDCGIVRCGTGGPGGRHRQARRTARVLCVARTFFGTLLAETLSYWLDRTLSARVGPGARFGNAGERVEFDRALTQYCAEATRIIKEFAAGWYARNRSSEDDFVRDRAAAFAAVALRKIGEELREKRRSDG